jgi:hypothetical protein
MEANLRDIVVKLSVNEVQQILAIEMDSDAQRALSFIKENFSKKVKDALRTR